MHFKLNQIFETLVKHLFYQSIELEMLPVTMATLINFH